MIAKVGTLLSGLLGFRPRHLQVGAVCLRRHKGERQVLLITSLGTGRYVIPKGWPMKGRSLGGAAAQEAWEEAGVRGHLRHETLGSYSYLKVQDGGFAIHCEVRVFALEVEALAERYPEAGRRKRVWMSPAEAAAQVAEPGLQEILRAL